jgi:hypothetical protein
MTANQLARAARKHLDEGDSSYEKAAEEMWQLRNEHGWTFAQIADAVGRGISTVRDHVAAYASHKPGQTFRVVGDKQRVQLDTARTRRTLRDAKPSEIAEEIVSDPEIRSKLTKALDQHYAKEAKASAKRRLEKDVEAAGGEEEYTRRERRQRISEIVNVTRGAESALRFVAGQAKGLELEDADQGAIDALALSLEAVVGFAQMLLSYLDGNEITDADLADLIEDGLP